MSNNKKLAVLVTWKNGEVNWMECSMILVDSDWEQVEGPYSDKLSVCVGSNQFVYSLEGFWVVFGERGKHNMFLEWEEHTESLSTHIYGYQDRERSTYKMLGYNIMIETHVPFNFLKKPSQRVIVDMEIKEDSHEMVFAKTFGAKWEECYYAEDGEGWPVWWSEDVNDVEKTWNYLWAVQQQKEGDW